MDFVSVRVEQLSKCGNSLIAFEQTVKALDRHMDKLPLVVQAIESLEELVRDSKLNFIVELIDVTSWVSVADNVRYFEEAGDFRPLPEALKKYRRHPALVHRIANVIFLLSKNREFCLLRQMMPIQTEDVCIDVISHELGKHGAILNLLEMIDEIAGDRNPELLQILLFTLSEMCIVGESTHEQNHCLGPAKEENFRNESKTDVEARWQTHSGRCHSK